jgi:type IV secretory pathway TrbL component
MAARITSLETLGALSLSVIETLLTFVGVPAAIVVVISAPIYAASARRGKRYRPGRPFTFAPVWFLSAASAQDAAAAHALTAGPARPALASGEAAEHTFGGDQIAADRNATGGASDRW